MTIDYIVSSLPTLAFDSPPGISQEAFDELVGDSIAGVLESWKDLEAQLRNAVALARGGEKWVRPVDGCSLYWRNRIAQCFQEKDVAKRDELLDRVWWDAAAELTPPASPLGKGALATYAVRLKIAQKRAAISQTAGGSTFDRISKVDLKI